MLETLVGAIIGAIIGGLTTYFNEERKRKKEYKQIENHAASILYYDLKSIEQYIVNEANMVNLRYSDEWQTMVANCTFLSDTDVMYLYKIYDEAYNYNESFTQKVAYKRKFKKEKITSYKKLQDMLFCDGSKKIHNMEYEKILSNLEKIKSKGCI